MNIETIFIDCLQLPVFARLEFLQNEQKLSNFSKETFLKILYNKWKEYKFIVYKEDLAKDFKDLVAEKGWEYAAITVHGDESEPYDHIYSKEEYEESLIEIKPNDSNVNLDWLNVEILYILKEYINKLEEKWNIYKDDENNSFKKDRKDFGFKNKSKIQNLSLVISKLCREVELLNQDKTSIHECVELLTCANYSDLKTEIHSGCKSNVFCYVFKSLKPYFNNLTSISISNSNKFFPQLSTKPFSISNFNKSGASVPKEKEIIDNIIKNL